MRRFSCISSPIFLDKNKIFLDHLIDQNDGSYFELKEKHLCKIDNNQARELVQTGKRIDSNRLVVISSLFRRDFNG